MRHMRPFAATLVALVFFASALGAAAQPAAKVHRIGVIQ